MPKFIQLNPDGCAWYGVVDELGRFVVEPEYTWSQAAFLAAELNENPLIDSDVLYQKLAVK